MSSYSYDRTAKAIRLTPKEIQRADSGYTVVVRPQADGGYMVAGVKIDGQEGRELGRPTTRYVKDQGQIQEAVKDVVRMMDKLSFPGDMGGSSRVREAAIEDPWLTQENVRAVCPPCADKMATLNIRGIRASAFFGQDALKLAGVKEAAKWEKLPKGWTEDSLKKFWNSMTGDAKHRVTKCMKQMEGKVTDTGAFCGGLASRLGER